jgi:hypothetical protein
MLPFGVTIAATVPQRSEIPEGLMNYHVQIYCGSLATDIASLAIITPPLITSIFIQVPLLLNRR